MPASLEPRAPVPVIRPTTCTRPLAIGTISPILYVRAIKHPQFVYITILDQRSQLLPNLFYMAHSTKPLSKLIEYLIITQVKDRFGYVRHCCLMNDCSEVLERVTDYFEGDKKAVGHWFCSRNQLLGDERPVVMVLMGRKKKLTKFVNNALRGTRA